MYSKQGSSTAGPGDIIARKEDLRGACGWQRLGLQLAIALGCLVLALILLWWPQKRQLVQMEKLLDQARGQQSHAIRSGTGDGVQAQQAAMLWQLALCDRLQRYPMLLLEGIPVQRLHWHSEALNGHWASAPRWSVTLSTDYPALVIMLRHLAALRGCLAIRSLRVTRAGTQLTVHFTLIAPDGDRRADG